MWQKCLIKDSVFPELVLKEVWGWVDNPQMWPVPGKGKMKFFVINLQAPKEDAPLGLMERDIVWLLRSDKDVREDGPPMVPRTQWRHPNWPGL